MGKESLFTTFKSLAGSAWGDESARVIINAIDAVCEYFDHPTPVHIFRFMADDKFREKVLADTKSPLLQMFREQYDEKLRDSEQMSKFSPPINKVGKLLRPSIIPIIGQTKSLDFLEIMNTNKIVVCRFSKGRLGEEIAQILGSLIVSMVSISALKREKQKSRPPFMLVADEVHNFVHGGRFGTLLAESRKYAITLVLASQGMYQLPFAEDVFSNCPTQIVFNVSGEDAKAVEQNWNEEQVQATHITSLPRYEFYCRTFIDDLPQARRIIGWPNVEKRGDEANQTKLIKQSLMRCWITYVDFVREGACGNATARSGNARWRRATEIRARGAKSVFHFDVQGSVAKSTHSGLPWLRYIDFKAAGRIHFWPFDGWQLPVGKSVVAEVYPALWSRSFAQGSRDSHQHDAYSIAAWMRQAAAGGSLAIFASPPLSEADRLAAQIEGWILGVMRLVLPRTIMERALLSASSASV